MPGFGVSKGQRRKMTCHDVRMVVLEHPWIGQQADRIDEGRIGGHELVAVDDPEAGLEQDRQDRMWAEEADHDRRAMGAVVDRRQDRRDRIGPGPDDHPIAPVLAAIRHGARGSAIVVCLLGPQPVLPILLQARFRIIDRDQFMASDPALVDPIRLLPNPGML